MPTAQNLRITFNELLNDITCYFLYTNLIIFLSTTPHPHAPKLTVVYVVSPCTPCFPSIYESLGGAVWGRCGGGGVLRRKSFLSVSTLVPLHLPTSKFLKFFSSKHHSVSNHVKLVKRGTALLPNTTESAKSITIMQTEDSE